MKAMGWGTGAPGGDFMDMIFFPVDIDWSHSRVYLKKEKKKPEHYLGFKLCIKSDDKTCWSLRIIEAFLNFGG